MDERDIFIAALEIATPQERSDFIRVACGGDSQLRQSVEALLQTHEQTGDFLQKPLVERLAEGVAALEEATEAAHGSGGRKRSAALGFLNPSDQPDSIGRLGHYEVLEEIGSGGMGIVLRAFDQRLHRVVAVKVMNGQLATNAAACKRFLREARAAAAVSHDHIITIYAVEESGELPYLVMQCVSGMSLQQRIDRDGPLALHQILRIGMQTAAGLAAAHAQGLIHRDIKPANILLENGVERVKITDFGLARAAADASISQTGIVAGTPQYMAPEQARGEAHDYRADLFSLGSVLYAMCTGRAPFRAANSMAVLKRVCDDTPSPIREANSEVPDWLVALIDKLQAKNPDGRYQSAAEVADILGQRLAQLQHSAPLPQLATPKTAAVRPAPRSWRLWAAAAAILLLLAATFGLAEGTGATNIASTVIRLLTPEGTLIVEINDPAVKVTVEGDGGLVITGAGLHEFHLRPGNYKVQADKNGRPVPLERELVSISKGGREVVRVKLEAGPAPAIAGSGNGPFVLLAAGKERKFDTLAEAVQSASDGDTIEVRGNGPFITEPVKTTHALTIRAGEGFRPVVRLSAEGLLAHAPLLVSGSSLVLEGLEFQRLAPVRTQGDPWRFGLKAENALRIANCRFLMKSTETCLETNAAVCELRNSEFLCPGWSSSFNSNDLQPGQRLVVENCVLLAGCELVYQHQLPNPVHVRLARNTFRAGPLWFYLQRDNLDDVARDGKVLEVEASDNLFDGGFVVRFEQYQRSRVPVAEAEKTLAGLLNWKGERNLFATGEPLVWLVEHTGDQKPANPVATLAAWRKFWETPEVNSIEGRVRYQGGDLLAKSERTPEQLTPQDWRLRPDSAGYRAGADGKDLGADVDLVGPGAAYERWKKTPEYQQWRKDTGQLRAETRQPEPGAFVRLGGKGGAERKFDTLADAVHSASDGDTIEIRGNGPFTTRPIVIVQQSLTIRAGEGYWPVINADPEEQADCLLHSEAVLALEGLDFRWVNAKPRGPGRCLVASSGAAARLHAVNCRFLMNRREGPHNMQCIGTRDSALCQLRNCQLLVAGQGSVYPSGQFKGGPQSAVIVENCLIGQQLLFYVTHAQPMQAVLNHNTILEPFMTIRHHHQLDLAAEKPGAGPFEVKSSGNILGGPLLFVQPQEFLKSEVEFSGQEGEQTLQKILSWRESGNLYSSREGSELLRLFLEPGNAPPRQRLALATPLNDLPQWQDFWGLENLDSQRGEAKFQGGNLVAKAKLDPEALAPELFRLRPDSPGYRAGADDKDLGADVELVGPGAAYERWKKTSEYQQWLKDTGQLRTEAPKSETGAFVRLGGQGVVERRSDTLAEAVQGASDGDTIEVRGNGPFTTEPIHLGKTGLTIRAGAGFRPVIQAKPSDDRTMGLLTTDAALALEGLELQRMVHNPFKEGSFLVIVWSNAPFYAANCRFLGGNIANGISARSPICELRNCEILSPSAGSCIVWEAPKSGSRLVVANCLNAVGQIVVGYQLDPLASGASIQLTHNTSVSATPLRMYGLEASQKALTGDEKTKLLRVEASGNLYDASSALCHMQIDKDVTAAEAEASLTKRVVWHGEQNLFSANSSFLIFSPTGKHLEPTKPIKSLADWRQFWGSPETGSMEGRVRYWGGDPHARINAAIEKLTPDDFRLRADSAGYRAGADGKDLGADVDLVGPGAAYERWKKTPEYQVWLKDTGQLRAEAPKPELGAFVRLGGQGVAERKFDTLAEAAQGASDGDTIEIRGNGPFVTEPVDLGKKVLTIRAATGFQPIIKGTADLTVEGGSTLLQCQGPLVLEGLELQMTGLAGSTTVHSLQAPVHAANCKFVLNGGVSLWTSDSPLCTVRNCQFVVKPTGYLQIPIYSQLPNNAKLILENNLLSGPCHHALELVWHRPDLHNVAVNLNHNSVATLRFAIVQGIMSLPESAEAGAAPDRQAVQMHVSSNLFFESMNSSERMLALLLPPDWYDSGVKPLSPTEAEGLLPRLMAWREERNLYSSGLSFQSMRRVKEPRTPEREFIDEPLAAYQTFADWQRMWKTGDSGSAEGMIRYEGGDVLTKMGATPEQITPEDFRLRPDSAGYRAGKDSKDLGADVDLVGPGAAYERWKKTPEYQEWLKESGQVK